MIFLINSSHMLPVILAGIIFLVVFVVGSVVHTLWFSRDSHIPGPRLCKITRLWLAYFDITLQRTGKIHEWHQQYGPVVLIAPGEVSFSQPSATREIYGAGGRHPKSHYFDHFISYGERATFNTLDYSQHRERRKHSFAFFQPTSIYKSSIVNPIRSRMIAFLDQVDKGVQVTYTLDFFRHVNLYAFDNITRLLLGLNHCSHTIETPCPERSVLEGLKECEVWNSLLFEFPLAHKIVKFVVSRCEGKPQFLTAEDSLKDWNSQRVTKILDGPSYFNQDNDCLLQRLQECKMGDGEPLTASWIKAEMLDNLNAAQTTVTVALTYVLWNIARNPGWQDRVREEIVRLPVQEDGFPSFSDVNSAPVLDACIKESYRVNPISSGRAERVLSVGKEYDGVFLPSGTIVSTSTIAIHHCPSVFTNPHIYDPNRWLKAGTEHLRAMETCYIPFGYGARVCLGKAFATVEVKLLVACLLSRYRISEDESSPTNADSMKQLGTQDALPKGLRCDLRVERLCLAGIC